MNRNTHNKIRRPLRIALGVLLSALFIALLGAASYHQEQQPLKGFDIKIVNKETKRILTKGDIERWAFTNPAEHIKGKSKKELSLKQIEEKVALNPWIANANAYIDNQHQLQILITERDPIARIFDADGNSFYMDSTLTRMPLIRGGYFNTPVFTDVSLTKADSQNTILKSKIAFMANLIGKDSFWNAQIEQIQVNKDQTFVLIPLMGHQKIFFGDTSRAKDKLGNLFAFYKHVVPKIGWNSYNSFDIRYKGQIVARPSLGITIPKPNESH